MVQAVARNGGLDLLSDERLPLLLASSPGEESVTAGCGSTSCAGVNRRFLRGRCLRGPLGDPFGRPLPLALDLWLGLDRLRGSGLLR